MNFRKPGPSFRNVKIRENAWFSRFQVKNRRFRWVLLGHFDFGHFGAYFSLTGSYFERGFIVRVLKSENFLTFYFYEIYQFHKFHKPAASTSSSFWGPLGRSESPVFRLLAISETWPAPNWGNLSNFETPDFGKFVVFDPSGGSKLRFSILKRLKNDMSKSYMNFSSFRWKILYKFLLRKNLYMKI